MTRKGNLFHLCMRDCNWPCLDQRGSPTHKRPGDRTPHDRECWDNWRNLQGQWGNLHTLEHTQELVIVLDDIGPFTYPEQRMKRTNGNGGVFLPSSMLIFLSKKNGTGTDWKTPCNYDQIKYQYKISTSSLNFPSFISPVPSYTLFWSKKYLAVRSGRVGRSTRQCKYMWIHWCRLCRFLHFDRDCLSIHWCSGHSLLLASQNCNCRCSQELRWWPVTAKVH